MVFMETGQNAPLRCLAGLPAKEGHAHGIFWRLVLAVTASLDCTAHDPQLYCNGAAASGCACGDLATRESRIGNRACREGGCVLGHAGKLMTAFSTCGDSSSVFGAERAIARLQGHVVGSKVR